MDINNLRAFVAVADQGSFSLAAEHLFLTQPAISKRIANLEADLGTQLFDRIGRNITLTEGGRQLLPRARHILNEESDIRRSLSALKHEVAGTLSMGTSHHIGLHRLPPVLRRYSLRYTEVELDLRFMDSENACAAVEQGELELGVVTLPNRPAPNLELIETWRDPLHFVAGPNHPLAQASHLTLGALTEHPAVLPGGGTYTRQILDRALVPRGITIRTKLATNYLETLKMLVSIGLGWSLLPETLIKGSDLRILKLDELRLARKLGVVRHQSRTLSNAARAMLEACLEERVRQ